MEEKGVKDRKREPEEYNFDYEELADAEVDSEQAGRRDDAVWETTCDTEDPYTVESEDFTEDEDYGEYPEGDDLDDFDEGGRDRLPVPAMDDSGFRGHDGSGGPDLYSAVETEPS